MQILNCARLLRSLVNDHYLLQSYLKLVIKLVPKYTAELKKSLTGYKPEKLLILYTSMLNLKLSVRFNKSLISSSLWPITELIRSSQSLFSTVLIHVPSFTLLKKPKSLSGFIDFIVSYVKQKFMTE